MKKLQLLILLQTIVLAALLVAGCTTDSSAKGAVGERVQVQIGDDGSTREQPL